MISASDMGKSGIQEACDKLGGQAVLAKAVSDRLGKPITQQAVSHWVRNLGYAPLDYVPAIAELTGLDRRRLCDPHILDVLGPE